MWQQWWVGGWGITQGTNNWQLTTFIFEISLNCMIEYFVWVWLCTVLHTSSCVAAFTFSFWDFVSCQHTYTYMCYVCILVKNSTVCHKILTSQILFETVLEIY